MKITLIKKFSRTLAYLKNKNLLMIRTLFVMILSAIEVSVENILRLMLTSLPLWAYVFLLQMRDKPQSVTTITNYFTDKSTFQFLGPNVMLVCVDGREYKNNINEVKREWNKKLPSIINIMKLLAYSSTIIIMILLLMYCGTHIR